MEQGGAGGRWWHIEGQANGDLPRGEPGESSHRETMPVMLGHVALSVCPRTQQVVNRHSRHYHAHFTEQNPKAW